MFRVKDLVTIVLAFLICVKINANFETNADESNSELAKLFDRLREATGQYSQQGNEQDAIDVENDIKTINLFEKFKIDFNRSYADNKEHAKRFRIFKENVVFINQLNKYELGTAEYGVTEFADFTSDEYFYRTGLRFSEDDENEIPSPMAKIPDIKLPETFDWRVKKAVTLVKDQEQCGSCWAFSVIGNIEGLYAVKTGKLELFSEQELLDCDTTDHACSGGNTLNAYKSIEKIGGLESEDEYPYHAHKEACKFNSSLKRVSIMNGVQITKDEEAIAKYLVANGPVSIGINAINMQYYHGGISHPLTSACSPTSINHAVLAVGFGVEKDMPYWIIKNSWGTTWGEKGYYRVFRGDNTCGVASYATSAVLQ